MPCEDVLPHVWLVLVQPVLFGDCWFIFGSFLFSRSVLGILGSLGDCWFSFGSLFVSQ